LTRARLSLGARFSILRGNNRAYVYSEICTARLKVVTRIGEKIIENQ
jgi:hypothetical protein